MSETESGELSLQEETQVQCPYCGEWLEIYVDPQSVGEMVQDCEVCCNPWTVRVSRDPDGRLQVWVEALG